MNENQKEAILRVFDSMKEIHGKTFIQKLFYILSRQIKGLALFEYFPYNYGPFSKELNQSVNQLIIEGYIQERKVGDYFLYQITDKGKKEAKSQKNIGEKEQKAILQLCKHVKHYTPRQILEYVYRKYPETTVNSLLKKNN
ncbi:hypothetical protein KY366_04250 [Candidatus Woesearchaeota archaeon]|nr:hypothetical protein [Candidatus Woesearchaeota archaeon]